MQLGQKSTLKRNYTQPRIHMQIIFCENCVAAGSSLLHPGKTSTPFTPEIESWDEAGRDSKYLDI